MANTTMKNTIEWTKISWEIERISRKKVMEEVKLMNSDILAMVAEVEAAYEETLSPPSGYIECPSCDKFIEKEKTLNWKEVSSVCGCEKELVCPDCEDYCPPKCGFCIR